MIKIFSTFFCFLLRGVFSLRYRIEFRGLEQLKLDPKKGTLFLPNHAALIDSFVFFLWLWPKYQMRPLAIEYSLRNPITGPFIRRVKGIGIPNFENSVNAMKIERGEKAVQQVAAGLKNGETFLLYPAGRSKSSGRENLRGTSAAHFLVSDSDMNVVLIRTVGFWGSSFSRAISGRAPDINTTIMHGVKTILKNFIFFAPRRKIVIEIETNPKDLPRKASRTEFNRYLERFYNFHYPEGEPLNLVSYSCFKQELLKPYEAIKRGSEEKMAISKETETKIFSQIRKILENPNLEIKPEMNLAFDLGMDSLNIAELVTYISRNYDVGELYPEELDTVQTVLECAEGAQKGVSHRPVVTFTWPDEPSRPAPRPPVGNSIPEAFLNACERMNGFSVCGDNLIGVLTYPKMKRAVFVLAEYFRQCKDPYIGVLLPASAGVFIVILAIQFAGKVPVMLNWTLGPRYLEAMMEMAGTKTIISSWRFLDQASQMDLGKLADRVQYLEDIRKNLTLKMKLRGSFLAKCSKQTAVKAYDLAKINENDPAVVLFTSGTEANPKGVPLSHKNIISNEGAAMQCLQWTPADVMYAILPPFHSFGFTSAGLLPILGCLKGAYYPDPTDSFGVVEGIDRWKVTLFCSAPSFLKGILAAAQKNQLKSVRYFVTGAEKTPDELYKKVERLSPNGRILEGYGVTECSPTLALCRPDLPPKGVGMLLPGIEGCTVHPETGELLPSHSEGEICVSGPNIFNGYLNQQKDPFLILNGKKWYRTGDFGHIDETNHVILSGRLKRFTKVGGEMISLIAIEETLINALHLPRDFPSLAICADEQSSDKSKVILFTTVDLEKEQANDILKSSGFSRLIKISQVQKIPEIPLMASGKTDYRKLASAINH